LSGELSLKERASLRSAGGLQTPRDIYLKIGELLKHGEDFAVATVVKTEGPTPRGPGAKMIVRRDGSIYGSVGGGPVERRVIEEALAALREGKPRIISFRLREDADGMACGGNLDVFIEPVLPESTILIFGGGHIGKALARLASAIGFPHILIDPTVRRDEIPAETRLVAENYVEALSKIEVNSKTCVVIATGSHEMDEEVLGRVIGSNAHYIGMVASRRKAAAIMERLKKRGVSEDRLKMVYTPIGLDIGAETPGEIAVSILAEIISSIHGKTVRSLRDG